MINLWSWRQPNDSWSFTKLQQQWVTARWWPWTWVVGCSQPRAQRSHRSRTRFLAECSTPPRHYHLHGWSMAPSSSMPTPTSSRFGRSLSTPPFFGYIDSTQLQHSSHLENAISWIYKKVKRWFWISSVTDAFCSHQVCHWRLFWPRPGIKDSFLFRICFLYLRKLLSPDTDLRQVYSGILDWRVCWLEKENLARRRESESTPVERSLRQQEPPSRVSQINSTNPFVFCLQQHPIFSPAWLSSCKTVVKRRAGTFLGRLSKGQTFYLLYYG